MHKTLGLISSTSIKKKKGGLDSDGGWGNGRNEEEK
jgi:hypothetical protein